MPTISNNFSAKMLMERKTLMPAIECVPRLVHGVEVVEVVWNKTPLSIAASVKTPRHSFPNISIPAGFRNGNSLCFWCHGSSK